MAIKKGDFIEVEYTGEIKEDGFVFDTTDQTKAKEAGIDRPGMVYGPVTICVGEGHLVKGLDEFIEGKEPGLEQDVELGPEDAFGKKSAKLVQLIPMPKFKKEGINPMPGMQVNIDGNLGIVKNVSGGRVLVDLNHPLSGKDVKYHIKINRLVTDDAEKVAALLKLQFNDSSIKVEMKEGTAIVSMKKEMPEQYAPMILEGVQKVIPNVKKLEFKKEEAPKQ
jgi:FKBP-type peptidyl-prolyl cis-trans isomerase 2